MSHVSWCRVALVALAFAACTGHHPAAPAPTVDLLVEDAVVVTMDAQRTVIDRGFVAVKDGRIAAVGPMTDRVPTARQVISAKGGLVIPGLINTHTHVGMTLLRGLCDGPPLDPWYGIIHEAEKRSASPEEVRVAARLAIAEMIRSGTTTFNDHFFHADIVAQAAKEAGMRAVVAETVVDGATPASRSPADALATTEALMARWRGDPLIRVAVGPHDPSTTSADVLRASRALADKYGALLHIHVAESAAHLVNGARHVEVLRSVGFLGDRVVAAHGVNLTPEDVRDLAAAHVGISYNPVSNMKLKDGIAPIGELLRAGVPIGIGTDSAASSGNLDLFQAMRAGAQLQLLAGAGVTARQVFEMATRGGAAVLAAGDQIGSLEPGKQADLVILAVDRPNLVPAHDLYSLLVYDASGSDVATVVIAGQVVMRDRELVTMDEGAVVAAARRAAVTLRARLHADPQTAAMLTGLQPVAGR